MTPERLEEIRADVCSEFDPHEFDLNVGLYYRGTCAELVEEMSKLKEATETLFIELCKAKDEIARLDRRNQYLEQLHDDCVREATSDQSNRRA